MNKTTKSLVEGMERLGLIASRIRKNEERTPKIEIDIILEELRNLYMVALQLEAEGSKNVVEFGMDLSEEQEGINLSEQKQIEEAAARKAAEEKRLAEEAAAKKAAEEKRLAEEAAAKKAAEEKRLAEEAAKKAAEERRLAEEAAAKKAAEEKRLAEEAAKKAAEERRLAEEAAAKKAAEEKRLAEEAAAKKAAEERARRIVDDEFHPVFAPPMPEKPTTPIMEPQMEAIAGNPNDELFSNEPAEKKQEPSILDLFKNESDNNQPKVRTLADTLNQHQRNVEEQLENRVHAKKVDDLRTIININDKFSFMSELFHNNMKAYNDFILQLNAIESRDEALAYVTDVATQYNWDSNSVMVKSFYKIFDRKF